MWTASKPGPHPFHAEPGIPSAPAFKDQAECVTWYLEHVDNLVAAVTAAADECPGIAVHIILAVFPYAISNPRMDYVALAALGIDLANRNDDPLSEAWLWRRLGVFHGIWERTEDCIAALEHALRLHQENGDEYGTIVAMSNLCTAHYQASRYDECLQLCKKVLPIIEQREEQDIDVGSQYATLAQASMGLGRYTDAVEYFHKSLEYEGSPKNRAASQNNLGEAYRALGRFDESIAALEASSRNYAIVEDAIGQAEVIHSLGRTYHELGDRTRARDHFTGSLKAFVDLGFQPGIERVEADLAALQQGEAAD